MPRDQQPGRLRGPGPVIDILARQVGQLIAIRCDDIGAWQQFVLHRGGDLWRDIKPPAIAKDRIENIGASSLPAPFVNEGGNPLDLPGGAKIAADDGGDPRRIGKCQDTLQDRCQNIGRNRAASPFSIAGMGCQHHGIHQKRMMAKRRQHRPGDGVADKADSDR